MKSREKNKGSIINYKNYVIIAIVLVIALAGVTLIFKNKTSKGTNWISKYALDSNRMIPVSKNGSYGFIDTKGNEVTKIEYDYILDYDGKYGVVIKDKKNSLIDQKGKEHLTTKGNIRYDSVNDYYVVDNVLYNNNLKQKSTKGDQITSAGDGYFKFYDEKKKEAGVINKQGKKVYKQDIEEDQDFKIYITETSANNKNTYCSITADNKTFAIINCDTGKVIINYAPQTVYANGKNVFQIKDLENDKIRSVYIQDDKVFLESTSTQAMYYLESGYVMYYDKKDNVKYYSVKEDKTYSSEPFELTQPNKSGLEKNENISIIYSNGKYGITQNDKIIVPCEYDHISFLPYELYKYLAKQGKHYAIARNGKKTYIIDIKTKERVKEFKTNEEINTLDLSTFIYYVKDKKTYVYNLVTNKSNSYDNSTVEIFGNYIKVHTGDKTTYYNRDLNKIYGTTEVEKNEDNAEE